VWERGGRKEEEEKEGFDLIRKKRRERDGRRNGSKQEQIHRGVGHC